MHLLFVRPPFVSCFLMCTQYISPIGTGRNTEEDLEWSCTEQRVSLGRGWTAVLIGSDLSFSKKKKRGRQKRKRGLQDFFIIYQTPSLFALLLQSPFQLNGFLSEMQMFSWMTLLWNIVERSPHSFTVGREACGPGAWALVAPVQQHWGWWDCCLASTKTIETLVNVSNTWSWRL